MKIDRINLITDLLNDALYSHRLKDDEGERVIDAVDIAITVRDSDGSYERVTLNTEGDVNVQLISAP